jgi:hypothetical protein
VATAYENAIATRNNLLQQVANETALMLANGPRPQYSLRGQSFNWESWLKTMREEIAGWTSLAQLLEPLGQTDVRGVT